VDKPEASSPADPPVEPKAPASPAPEEAKKEPVAFVPRKKKAARRR
jgi:hypothetical protein